MLDWVAKLPWFWLSVVLALGMFLGLARRLAPARRPKVSGVGPLPTTGLMSGMAVVAVAALVSALVGVYIPLDFPGMSIVNYVPSFFGVMAIVLVVLRLIWPRDFALPVVNGYSVSGSILQGVMLAVLILVTVGTSLHVQLGWVMPTCYQPADCGPTFSRKKVLKARLPKAKVRFLLWYLDWGQS